MRLKFRILLVFCVVGWSDFEKKEKLDTCHVVHNLCKTPIPKFYFEMLFFNSAQGLRKC